MKQIFPGVWKKGNRLFTKNLLPGDKTYTKTLLKFKGNEYREWDPYRSKPAAAILKGLKTFPLKKGMKILYLGIANGATASFFSDIIGKEGVIYGIEISERSIRDLNPVAEKRGNIVPILGNAKLPNEYSWIEKADIVYEDVATDDQSEVLVRNCKEFLKPDGFAMIAIKARSIDVVKSPKTIYKQEISKLQKHFKILEKIELDPYEKDHMFLVMKWM
ncbi:MAG: fibrillarin-like rRNA/tRNA 2'-O-methyltransferase [Candidatus Aenigmatarchaeota archaeon]|nr:MAG: fibrillarin-like rRNA/tRNA 2'-O-methyltransferase [Candidatus Aenigmarchaeota archaeon]RLJ07968.1 MAG: fibrillarin-like rRNA/tRNA 2'-O-methyltransferase [Candidatus Aenigmarchaeota archaeon]RLJ08381.1 MAG: fibrillarin-like rRNA/tRNA 2'-O-methyltransferase [Candidatus Aenigmarchaeota archaeon]